MRKMKDSGIAWIGKIPEGWETAPISTHYEYRNEKVSDYEYAPLSVTKLGIVPQLEDAAKTDAHDSRKKVCVDDFVINSRSDRKQSCGLSSLQGSVSLINTVLIHKGEIIPKYTAYLLNNYAFAEEFYRWGTGIVADLWSTKWELMKRITVPIPSKTEQHKIADYLDQKCAEIDKLIELQESMIEKLKEYKQSVITHAVTKGLDPDVPMKDSGIEWIGKIPEGWATVQLKNMATVYNGKEIENEIDYDNNAIEVYGSGGVFKYTDKYLYDGTAVLFGRKGSIGKPILVKNKQFWAVDTMYYSVPKVNANANYLYYMLIIFQWDLFATKTALPSIVATQVFNSVVMLPPLEEQHQIADYLDKKCAEIDNLIELKEQKIEKLKEYKKSLIYEYVTGKKEVC